MLTNGAIFSTFKHADLHTIRDRSTLKDGVVNEHIFQYGQFRQLKIPKELNELAKVLLGPKQKSNELSMNRKCGQRFTTGNRGTLIKVLDVDKNKVRCNHTLANNNKDGMFDCKSGFCQSEDKCNLHLNSNCHIYLASIIYYVFAQKDLEYIISCYFSIFAFVCVLYLHGMSARYQITCQMNVFHVVQSYIFFQISCSSEVLVLSDIRPFRNLTFYYMLARQGSLFCNRAHLSFEAFVLHDIKCRPKKAVVLVKR